MKKEHRAAQECAYFAASNSRGGFTSYYEDCFRHRVDALYCIKGGPGTGKSTFMRRVATAAEHSGYRAEYYYCSSDANSLDAVLLYGEERSIGLLDATAPHAFEPNHPGVWEHVMDLGQFWDAQVLAEHREEIEALNRQKSEAYRAAYRFLAGAGEVSDALRDVMAHCLNGAKIERTATRLLRDVDARGQTGEIRIGLRDSLGMQGRVVLDTYLRQSERLCLVEDYYDSAYVLMACLAQKAGDIGLDVHISYHPILPDRVDALLLTASRTVFAVCQGQEARTMLDGEWGSRVGRVIDMKRMVDREKYRAVREQVRRMARLRDALLDEAASQMQRVSSAHFSLEQIYGSAMDFQAEQAFCERFCREQLGIGLAR